MCSATMIDNKKQKSDVSGVLESPSCTLIKDFIILVIHNDGVYYLDITGTNERYASSPNLHIGDGTVSDGDR